MLKKMLGAAAMLATLLIAAVAPAQTIFRPVAVVNDSAITGYDLAQRAQILAAMGFQAASADALRAAALDRLIEDRLKLQAAKRAGIAPTAEMVEKGLEEYAKQIGTEASTFRAAMSAKGVTEQGLADMVGAEMVWREVIIGRFGRRVEPGEAEVDAEIALMQQREGASYQLQEIGLPDIDGGRNAAETQALALQLYESLTTGGDFAAAVRKYSRAPSAARGGDAGWVATDRLPPDLAEALSGAEVGQIVRPLRVAGGYTILKIVDKRLDQASQIDPSDQNLRNQIRQRLANQQTLRLAEGMLQELRRDALIELR